MKKSKIVQILLISFIGILGLSLTGCASRIPVKTPTYTWEAQSNLSKSLKREKSSNLVIGIVDPETQTNGSKEFENALTVAISEIISAKGFKLKGPYESFDDITYRDKKMIYLVFRPKLELNIKAKATKRESHPSYNHYEGVYTATGSLILSVVEPMTGQTFIKRRINLSDLGVSEKYVYEVQKIAGSMTGQLIDAATAPTELLDTRAYAKAKLENELYKKVVAKIAKYIDREEIISFKPDILKLKGLKRF